MISAGKLTSSQIKIQSFFFDCADPAVNFTDGIYRTDLVLKNGGFSPINFTKFFQDVSAYPPITIKIFTDSSYQSLANTINLPYPNVVDGFDAGGNGIGAKNNNNVSVFVQLIGITGSGVTALSFETGIIYFEFDF
jgi:hypothetical protein